MAEWNVRKHPSQVAGAGIAHHVASALSPHQTSNSPAERTSIHFLGRWKTGQALGRKGGPDTDVNDRHAWALHAARRFNTGKAVPRRQGQRRIVTPNEA